MKHYLLTFFLICFIVGCGNKDDYPKADNALVSAQSFLDACMKGDFKRADFYMIQDSTNKAELKLIEKAYYLQNSDERVEYRSANIIIQKDDVVTPDQEVITYQNSYDKITKKLKAIQNNGQWQVDLKYTLSGNL